ncbi:MAG TPA: ABC transporter ATP-binding protein [Candidatus Dormibacteraeota bacterium]
MSAVVGTGRTSPAEPATSSPTAALQLIDVFKIHKEGEIETVALRGVDLAVERGETVALLGPSGSGKSTLLSLVAGLSLPSAGRVVVHGQDLTRLDEGGRALVRASSVGIVFQRGNLIPFLTAEENVAFAVRQGSWRGRRQRARSLLERLGLRGRLRHRPCELSGGEVQRVGIAVALANDPTLLLGDEVTGELDTATADAVMTTLLEEQRARGLSMVLVTHNAAVAKRADRRLGLIDGRVRPL